MVLIIIATCAGVEVLSAISAQAAPLRPPWPLRPDSLFPSYRGGSSRMLVRTRATSVAPPALGVPKTWGVCLALNLRSREGPERRLGRLIGCF
jgi:hypothetical protein